MGSHEQNEIRSQLARESRRCALSGSPMYAHLLELVAHNVAAGGTAATILGKGGNSDLGPPGARFLAGLHELVLSGVAEELAAYYPSAGGDWRHPGLEDALGAALTRFRGALEASMDRPIQANEVGRAAALLAGFHLAHRLSGLPLRLLELGSSAGLNLWWDCFFFAGSDWHWGDPQSPVGLTKHFESGSPVLIPDRIEIAGRLGCDRKPLRCGLDSDLVRMKSFIWADQARYRFGLLEAAWRLAAAREFLVEQANAREWLAAQELLVPRTATVLFHSIFWEYLPCQDQEAIQETVRQAGESATKTSPLVWLRLEPLGPKRTPSVWVTMWPQGLDTELARCRFDGSGVRMVEGFRRLECDLAADS